MRQERKPYTPEELTAKVREKSWRSNESLQSALKRAEMAKTDSQRATRLARHECPYCYYIRGAYVAGCAMSTAPCFCCGKDVHSGSTHVDQYCAECAKKYKLCVECGGDVEMRVKRRKIT